MQRRDVARDREAQTAALASREPTSNEALENRQPFVVRNARP